MDIGPIKTNRLPDGRIEIVIKEPSDIYSRKQATSTTLSIGQALQLYGFIGTVLHEELEKEKD